MNSGNHDEYSSIITMVLIPVIKILIIYIYIIIFFVATIYKYKK